MCGMIFSKRVEWMLANPLFLIHGRNRYHFLVLRRFDRASADAIDTAATNIV